MRFSSLLLLGATALASGFSWDEEDSAKKATYFNGIRVPPMLELTPENFADAVKSAKHVFIKHYSPYCPHCVDFAPTFQTLYEYYYTSRPEGSFDSFTHFYDFRFAAINCITYYDMCHDHNVASYPSTILYSDGQLVELLKGVKPMETLGEFVEKTLEQSKPGTRPKTFVLPKPGDKGLPNQTAGKEHGDTIASPANTLPAAAKSPASQALSPPIPPPIAPKKRGPMNTEGESVTLTLDNFEQRVTKSDEPWLIKFYAPWCHHCQAMAPKWAQMAKTMKGKLNVGQVNCDQEKRLCKSLDVHAYPTILFFDGEEHVEYRGLRGLGDFISYAEKGLQLTTTIPDVDAESFKTMEAEDDVIFVYFHDHATTTEDFEAVKKLPLHLIGRAKIVTTSDPAMFRRFKITTWPRMLVSREGRPSYYDPITPREMRDVKLLLDWIKTVWLPLVPELTAATATEIMQGKIVALAVLSRGQDALFASSQREIKSVANDWMDREIQEFQRERKKLRDAKKMRIDEAEDRNDQRAVRNAKNIRIDMHQTKHKDVAFAWVDGVFWLRWLKTTYGVDVHQGERVIIIDEDNRRYWDTTAGGDIIPISRTRIADTLDIVVNNPVSIKPKLTVSTLEKLLIDFKMLWVDHLYLSLVGTLGAIYLIVQYLRLQARRSRGPSHFADDAAAGLGIKRAEAGAMGASSGKTD